MRILILAMVVLLSGCYSHTIADKQLDRAHKVYPKLTAEKTMKWYPPKIVNKVTQTVKKDTIRLAGTTKYVNCDSIVKEEKSGKTPKGYSSGVPVDCPELVMLRERIERDSIASIENTAALFYQQQRFDSLGNTLGDELKKKDAKILKQSEEINDANNAKSKWRLIAIIIIGVAVLALAIKLFGGYIKSFIKPI